MRRSPSDPRAVEQLASVYADAGDAAHLAPLADTLVTRYPQRDKPRFYRTTALLLAGHAREAIDESRQLIGRNPRDPRAQNLLGVACATAGLRECASAHSERRSLRTPATRRRSSTLACTTSNRGNRPRQPNRSRSR